MSDARELEYGITLRNWLPSRAINTMEDALVDTFNGENVILTSARLDGKTSSADSAVSALIRLAKAGDTEAIEELLSVYQDRILRLATIQLGNKEDARDAAQEVFLRFFRYLHRFDESRRLSPWLYQITLNVCRDMMRSRISQETSSLDDLLERGVIPEPVSADNLEHENIAGEQGRIIMSAIRSLPEKERSALVLRDIEGLSTKEVASILKSSEATVRSQICSARIKIKRYRDRLIGRK